MIFKQHMNIFMFTLLCICIYASEDMIQNKWKVFENAVNDLNSCILNENYIDQAMNDIYNTMVETDHNVFETIQLNYIELCKHTESDKHYYIELHNLHQPISDYISDFETFKQRQNEVKQLMNPKGSVHVTLQNQNLNDVDAIYIGYLLKFNDKIKTLDLGYNKITHIGLEAILSSLEFNSRLTILSFMENEINNPVNSKKIIRRFQNTTLHTLYLHVNEIEDTSIIVQFLQCFTLLKLQMRDNPLLNYDNIKPIASVFIKQILNNDRPIELSEPTLFFYGSNTTLVDANKIHDLWRSEFVNMYRAKRSQTQSYQEVLHQRFHYINFRLQLGKIDSTYFEIRKDKWCLELEEWNTQSSTTCLKDIILLDKINTIRNQKFLSNSKLLSNQKTMNQSYPLHADSSVKENADFLKYLDKARTSIRNQDLKQFKKKPRFKTT